MFKLSRYNYYEESNEGYYIYNFLYRTFIYINVRNKKDMLSLSDFNETKMLIKYGIILYESIDEVRLMKNKINEYKYNKNLSIFISLTSSCNFNCSYCYQDYRKDLSQTNYLSAKKAKVIKKYIKNAVMKNNLKEVSLVYFGGEPIIDDMRFIEVFNILSENEGVNTQNVIITNGYILSQKLIDTLVKSNAQVQITLDGDKFHHDSKRVLLNGEGTFEQIYNNLIKLSGCIPNKIVLRINVDVHNYESIFEFVDKLEEDSLADKLNSISFYAIFDSQNKNYDSCLGKDKIHKLYEYAKSHNFKCDYSFEFGPCVFMSNTGLTVDENLKAYTCPGFLYDTDVGEVSEFGNLEIYNNIWYSDILDDPKCVESCIYAPVCYGGCRMNNSCNKENIENILPLSLKEKIQNYEMRQK